MEGDASILSSSVGRAYAQPEPDPEVAFTLQIERDFEQYVKESKGTSIFTTLKEMEFKFYIEHPDTPITSKDPKQQLKFSTNRHFAKAYFEVQDGVLCRKGESKIDKDRNTFEIPPRYVARVNNAFQFITDIHRNLQHFGIRKTYERVAERYWGITRNDVAWVVNRCLICNLTSTAKSTAIPIPIVSSQCLNRLYIDLMDFRTTPDRIYNWLAQLKDHFSQYIWLAALPNKEALTLAYVISSWIGQNGQPRRICCDNGNEFKGEFLDVLKYYRIPKINGRPYHPQSQGSVERANATFKNRLNACQAEYGGTQKWVRFLPDIAQVVNTTWPSVLPVRSTPYEVWFGRKPHWVIRKEPEIGGIQIDAHESGLPQNLPGSDDEDSGRFSETDIEAEEYTLTELEHLVCKNNTRVAAQMVKKARGKAWTFQKGWLITLAISSKLRLHTEPKRILCRIDQFTKNQYSLSSTKGPLCGGHSASQLNPVEAPDQSLIPMNWPEGTTKLTLTKAVQLINNRGTIRAAQKAARVANKPERQRGRKRKQPEPEPEPEPELVVLRTSSRKRQKRTGAFEN